MTNLHSYVLICYSVNEERYLYVLDEERYLYVFNENWKMSTSNKQSIHKKSKLSRSKKTVGQGLVTVEPICNTAVLNETCDFKEPKVCQRDLSDADRYKIGQLSDGKISEFVSKETCGTQGIGKETALIENAEETILCQVCSKNISHYNCERRLQHVNRCIDKLEDEKKEERKAAIKQVKTSKSPVLDCPMCRKAFKSTAARQTHLKKCASINNVSTEAMLKLVKDQEQKSGVMSNSTTSCPSSKPPKSDKTGPSRKRKIKEPKSQFDEDVQLAMAVSSSLADQNKTAAELMEENLQGITGQNKKRRKKNVLEDVCLLTTLSEEDKQRRIEQKLHTLLVEEKIEDSEEEEDHSGIPSLRESSLKTSNLQSKNKLWQRSNHHDSISDIMIFYVNSLMPPIVPNQLPTASKLRRLSSIPGREKSFISDNLDKSLQSNDHVDDVYTASTQTAVVLAELAVDGVNNETMDLSKSADLSLHASGFCEEILVLQTEELGKSREETLNTFKQMINQPDFSDVMLKTSDGGTVYGHKSIIFTRFPQLRQLLDTASSSVCLPLSRDSTLSFLTYIYTGELQCTASIQHELREMADKLDLPGLTHVCNTLTPTESVTEKLTEEYKSELETVKLQPIVNMKDIWGESDSDISDDEKGDDDGDDGTCDGKKVGTDTDFEMDRQEAICDEDYRELMCTQKLQRVSHALRPEPFSSKDESGFTLAISERRASSQEGISNKICDQKGSTCDTMKRKDHSEHVTLNLSQPDIERKDKEENKSATRLKSNPEKYADGNISDLDDSHKSCDSASVLGNNSSFDVEQLCEVENDLNNEITSCDKNFQKSAMEIQFEGENNVNDEINSSQVFNRSDRQKMNTSNVDLFQSPYSPDVTLQSATGSVSPSSPLFNKKRKKLFDTTANHVIELDLESEDENEKEEKSSKTEGQVSYDDGIKKLSVENDRSFSHQSCLNSNKKNTAEWNENKTGNTTNVPCHISPSKCNDNLSKPCALMFDNGDIEITGDSFIEVKSKKEKSKEHTFLGPQINIRLSQPSPHPVKKESEPLSYDLDDTNSKLNACDNDVEHTKPISSKYTQSSNYTHECSAESASYISVKENERNGKMESEDDIELISLGNESNNSLLEDEENNDKNCGSVCSDPEKKENSFVGEIADVWEDFDDCGMGFENALSPVLSQSIPEKQVILHKRNQDRDGTLVEASENGIEELCDDDDNVVDDDCDDLRDTDNSFVFHANNNAEKEKTEERAFKTPTVGNSTRQKKTWVPPSPFTPMPDYDKMNTPALKKEVKKYGVKPVSKKRMVTVLKDIYQQTHQYETDSEFEDDCVNEKSNIVQTTLSNNVQKSRDETLLAQDALPSSQESNTSDLMEESVMMAESTSDSDTQSSPQKNVDIKKKLHSFITSDQDLHMRVLMYEPLELDVLKANLKEAGIKCSSDKLLEFLDERCIAFTSKNTRKRAQSKKGTKKASSKPG